MAFRSILTLSCLAAFVALCAPAQAAVFDVNTVADGVDLDNDDGLCLSNGGSCTLRAAIQQADSSASPGADAIRLPAGDYTLTLGELDPKTDMTIEGAGTRVTRLLGDGFGRVLNTLNGTILVRDLTISGGRGTSGGGVRVSGATRLTLERVTVSGNTVSDSGEVDGGGIFAHTTTSTITIRDSAIVGNTAMSSGSSAQGGGMQATAATVTMTNTTVAQNSASGATGAEGGGLLLGQGTLTNVTVAGNGVSGGGTLKGTSLFVTQTLSVANSILAGGSASVPDCGLGGGEILGAGRNIQTTPGCGGGPEWITANPLLGPLGSNGGPTDTRVPALGSPALDAALGCPPPSTDQRGNPRPLGAACDIGAVEVGADLGLTMLGPAQVRPGESFIYTLIVSNYGVDTADGVTLTDTLPAGLTLLGTETTGGSCSAGPTVSCALGRIAAGIPVTVKLAVRADVERPLANTAFVAGTLPDPVGANNSASLLTSVADTPVISSLAVTNPVFRVNRSAAPARRAPRGTAFRFQLSEPARVAFTIDRRTVGRRVGGRCRRTTQRNRTRPRCIRFVRVGGFDRVLAAGRRRVPFSGRLRRGRRVTSLSPGRYRVNLLAVDPANNRSRTVRAAFRVVR